MLQYAGKVGEIVSVAVIEPAFVVIRSIVALTVAERPLRFKVAPVKLIAAAAVLAFI